MDFEPALFQLIGDIYQSAFEPDMWSATLVAINRYFDSDHTILMSRFSSSIPPFGASVGISAEDQNRHLTPRGVDLWMPVDAGIRSGKAIVQGEVISDSNFERSDFYNELVKPTGGFHSLHVKQANVDVPFQLTACRKRRDGEYTDDAVSRLNILLPHLTTAFELHGRLKTHIQRKSGLLALLDSLDDGVVLVGSEGRIHFINARAEAILDSADGIAMRDESITLASLEKTQQLRSLIASVSMSPSGGGRMVAPRRAGRLPLLLRVLPVRSPAAQFMGSSGPSAVLFLKEPDVPGLGDKEVIAALFGLTEREAEIASLVATGASPEKIALLLEITVGTVRWNLKSIYGKTGVEGRTALAVLVHQSR